MSRFGYVEKLFAGKSTRERSYKQESRIAAQLRGHTTVNSGAAFSQNDVIADFCEVEAKTTQKESYTLKLSDWRVLSRKCSPVKMPILVLDFEKSSDSLAVLKYDDLLMLVSEANGTNRP